MAQGFLTYSFSKADVTRALRVYVAQERYVCAYPLNTQPRDMSVYVSSKQISDMRALLNRKGINDATGLRQRVTPKRLWRTEMAEDFSNTVMDPHNPPGPVAVPFGLWRELVQRSTRLLPPTSENRELRKRLNQFMIPGDVLKPEELIKNGQLPANPFNG